MSYGSITSRPARQAPLPGYPSMTNRTSRRVATERPGTTVTYGDRLPALVPTTDPAKLAGSRTSPEDFQGQAPAVTEVESAVVRLMDERIRIATEGRRSHETRWLKGLKFFLGDQWVSGRQGKLVDVRSKTDPTRVYRVVNKLRPLAHKHMTRALSGRADFQVSPFSDRPEDLNAARQARSVGTHIANINDWEAKLLEAIIFTTVCGPVFSYCYWNKDSEVPFPRFDKETGEISDIVDAPMGEVCIELCYWHELLLSPKARRLDDADWVIYNKRMPTRDVIMRWPHAAHWVKSEGQASQGDWPGRQVEQINEDTNFPDSELDYCTVSTMYEQPSPRHPRGRYVVKCQGRYLEKPLDGWPHKSLRHPHNKGRYLYPFTELMHERGVGSFWGDNALTPVEDLQASYNRFYSLLEERAKAGQGKFLSPRGCLIDDNAFRSSKRDEIVYYKVSPEAGNREPHWIPTPPLDPVIMALLERIERDMADIMEVQDVSRGREPYAGAPAAAIMALLDADSSSAALFQENIKYFVKRTFEKALAIAQENYNSYRLLFVQDTGNGKKLRDKPKKNPLGQEQRPGMGLPPGMGGMPTGPGGKDLSMLGLMPDGEIGPSGLPDQTGQDDPFAEFDALVQEDGTTVHDQSWTQVLDYQKFGRGRIVVTSFVSPPKTPAARAEVILNMARAGMLSPDLIPVTIVMLEALEITSGNKETSDLLTALRRYEARQDAVRAQEAQLAAAQQAGAGSQNAQAKMEQIAAQAQYQQMTDHQRAQLQIQQNQLKAQAQASLEEQKADIGVETNLANQQIQAAFAPPDLPAQAVGKNLKKPGAPTKRPK